MAKRKLLTERDKQGDKCATCINKVIPGAILTCRSTNTRIRHYQDACENYKKDDV